MGKNKKNNLKNFSQKKEVKKEDISVKIPVESFTLMQVRQEIKDFIINTPVGVLVVNVPTGGGKTYGLPYIIKEDVVPHLPNTRMVMLEANRVVAQDVRKNLADAVLNEKVGLRIGRDQGLNYKGERFTVGTTGASFKIVKEGNWSIIVLDEFDLDQNGDVAIMQNHLYKMLHNAQKNNKRLVVILPSATPDLVNAKKFYEEFPYKELQVEDRIFNPDILEVDLGSVSVESFRDIMDKYVSTLTQLCGDGVKNNETIFKIPAGKNILCTVPSPVYFDELENKILNGVDVEKVEVVKVWSRSTPAEKKKLFSGGTLGMITVFIATDLIRRGGTPEIYATLPSGWQVRNFCDVKTGIEGTREERASKADYSQDEGRCSRKDKGLVVHSLDSKRPEVGLTFLERNPLEIFLLNLIHHEDIRNFKWWGEVEKEKIETAINELKKVNAVEETNSRLALTSLGKAMRGIPGSLRMRSMTFDAQNQGVLDYFLVISAGMATGGLFANTKGREEIKEKQASLLCNTSDYLSVLRVWNVISDALQNFGVNEAIASANADIDFKKNQIRTQFFRDKQEANYQLFFSQEEMLEKVALIEMGRQDKVEQAIIDLAKNVSGKLAFEKGLYKRSIEMFVQNVVRTVGFLNGKKFSYNGHGEQTISLNLGNILAMGMIGKSEEEIAVPIHSVVLGGYADQLRKNCPYRGDLGCYYKGIISDDNSSIAIFPGSATFKNDHAFLIGIPVDLKGKKFITNVVMFDNKQIAEIFPKVAPQFVEVKQSLSPKFNSDKDMVVSTTRIFIKNEEISEKEIEDPNHQQAPQLFASWLADKMAI